MSYFLEHLFNTNNKSDSLVNVHNNNIIIFIYIFVKRNMICNKIEKLNKKFPI